MDLPSGRVRCRETSRDQAMTDLRTAAQHALEAMDELHRTGDTQVFDLCHRETTEALRSALAEPVQEPVAGAAKSVHEKAYSEVELAAAYQKGWSDAMLRRSLGPHIIKEGT